MNNTLKDIFEKKVVRDENGREYPLHSHISSEQGEMLQKAILDIKPKKSLEIGLAYGISSLFICEALDGLNNNHEHIIVDPEADEYWKNIGIYNLKKHGYYKFVRYYKDYSYNILPDLYKKGERIQFAYIDSTKLMDVLFVDFFYITKMLDIGGVVIFDDCCIESIRNLARYINQIPCYKVYLRHNKDNISKTRLFLNNFVNFLFKLIPFKSRVAYHFLLDTDINLKMNYHCIGFQKIKEDDRNWDWFKKF